MKKTLQLFSLFLLLTSAVIAQSQQVLGEYPRFDGGFEGMANGQVTSGSIASGGTLRDVWSVSTTTGLREIYGTGGRSGPKFFRGDYNATSTKRIQSPTTNVSGAVGGAGAILNSTSYVVQFYYRTWSDSTPKANKRIGIGVDGTTSNNYSYVTMNASPNTWTKVSGVQVSPSSSVSPRYGIGIIQWNSNLTNDTVDIDFDDFVVYAGTAVDVTAPDAVTAPSITSASSTSLSVAWTAPGTGVDGGGYLVLRGTLDPSTDPNVNGIYALGGTIGNATIAYIGTSTSFADNGLSPSTTYYYKVYTVDKAFNYSLSASTSGTTNAPNFATEPTLQPSNLIFSNVLQTSMTLTWTNGDGASRLVVARQGSAVTGVPSDGGSYTADTVFGNGSTIGAGNYVVYGGSGNSVNISGLQSAVTYHFAIYEFNGSGGTQNYLTTSPLTGSQTTDNVTITSNGTGGGAWNSGATWQGGTPPSTTSNAVILSGDSVWLPSSSMNTFNLTVNAGGKLGANGNTVGSPMYLIINGTTVTNNGNIGGDWDGLGLYIANTVTINGTGVTKIARIQPYIPSANLTFNADVNLMYRSGLTSSGTAILLVNGGTLPAPANKFASITLNAGKTLTFRDYARFTTAGTEAQDWNVATNITINGNIVMGDTSSQISLRSTAGNTITFTVNGAVNTRSFNPCNTAGDNVSTVTVGASGSLTVGSPITGGTVDFGNPNQIITGEGSFTLRPTAYLQIGSPNGLNPTTGPIRVSTRSFSKLAHYTYMGAAAQVTGAELPDSIGLLTVNNSANLTLTNPVFLNNGISFNAGKLFTGSNDIVFGPSASSSGTYSDAINLVAGTGLVKKMFSGTGSFTFPLGDTTGTAEQSPIRLSFTTGTFSPTAYVTAKVVNGMHPNNTSAFSYLNRYWTLTPSGISNFTADVVAKYPNADAVGTETDIYCGKWNGSNWTGYANVDAVNDSIKAYTITSFSDFSGGEMSAMGGVNGLMTCKFAPEGYYDTGLNRLAMRDTFTVYLANTTTPYAFVDSSLITIDSVSLSGIATFANAANGTYYLAVKGRNIVETWSKTGGETFTKGGQMSYDFTSAQAQSYGSNAVVKGSKWCIYSGDVTQDGFIDFSDLSQVDNDQYNFVGGYVVTDLTGDMFVDFSDLSLCDNNQYNFIGTVKPGGKRIAKPVRPAVMKTMLPY